MTTLQATVTDQAREVMTTAPAPQGPGSEAGRGAVQLLLALAKRNLADAEYRKNLALAQQAGDIAHAVMARNGGSVEAQAVAYHLERQRVGRELGVAAPCACGLCAPAFSVEKVA